MAGFGSRELVSAAGLRGDGRRPREVRRVRASFGALATGDGSAYLEHGLNKVVASVTGPRSVSSRSRQEFDRARITCEVAYAPFARTEHRKTRTRDRRALQVSLTIQKLFEAVVQSHLFPRTQIDIFIQVLQSDGGVVATCINAVTLALCDAGIPCTDFVVACSAGMVDNVSVLDLNFLEASSGGDEVLVALLPATRKVLLAEMKCKMSIEAFEEALQLAQEGCMEIYELLKAAARERVESLVQGATP